MSRFDLFRKAPPPALAVGPVKQIKELKFAIIVCDDLAAHMSEFVEDVESSASGGSIEQVQRLTGAAWAVKELLKYVLSNRGRYQMELIKQESGGNS